MSESCVQLEPNGILWIKREYLTSYCHLSWRILSLEANNSGNAVILKLLSRSCCCCSFKIFNMKEGRGTAGLARSLILRDWGRLWSHLPWTIPTISISIVAVIPMDLSMGLFILGVVNPMWYFQLKLESIHTPKYFRYYFCSRRRKDLLLFSYILERYDSKLSFDRADRY